MEGNVLLLTSRGEDDSLTREIFQYWEREQAETAQWGKGRIGNLTSSAVKLEVEVSLSHSILSFGVANISDELQGAVDGCRARRSPRI